MNIRPPLQADNTREKLRMLEEQYERAAARTDESEFVRDATPRLLKRLINQLKEELAWFESRTTAGVSQSEANNGP